MENKLCFNCEKNIEKPEECKCQNCGIEFEPTVRWTEDMAKICDEAVKYKRNGEFDKSIKIYQHLIIDYPNNPIIYRSWAKTLIASGNYDLALDYLIKAKKLAEFYGSIDPDAEKYINRLMYDKRDTDDFLNFLKQISGNPNFKVDYNKINDHIDISENFEKHKSTILDNLNKNKAAILATGIINNYIKENGKDSITPEVYFLLGLQSYRQGEKEVAKKLLILGSLLGLTTKTLYYNSSQVEVIGRCLTVLLTDYSLNKEAHDTILKTTILAYIYLSRAIEKYPETDQYPRSIRSDLFTKDHQGVIREMIGRLSFVEPYIISDCYFAAKAKESVFPELLTTAEELHEWLEDMTVEGKDANEYTLQDIAEIGESRHKLLFKVLEKKYINGEYDITEHELENIFEIKEL